MLLDAVKSLLREKGVGFPEDAELSVYDDFDKGWGGGCETCGYGSDEDTYEIGVTWQESGTHKRATTVYTGSYSFGTLMNDLARQG